MSPPPAPGEDRSIALALINTELAPRSETLDLLSDPGQLHGWLRGHQLATPRGSTDDADDLERVHQLRTAARALFIARAHGARPPRSALAAINRAAALAPRISRLVWRTTGPHPEIDWPADATPLDVALARIANDAIETVLGVTGERLRACEAHGCNRMFIQDHGRRQWCSRTCGDRVRFARHYRRTHADR